MYGNFSHQCDEKIVSFRKKLKDPSFNFRDIKSIAEFNHANIRLYDLQNDPSERYDLFTNTRRWESHSKDMYDFLGERSKEMSDLIFFVGEEYRDVPSAYQTLTLDEKLKGRDDRTMNKWKPWLPNNN